MKDAGLPTWLRDARNMPLLEPGDSAITHAINSTETSLQRMAILLSQAADEYLEEMAQNAHQLTARHFGKTVSLYAPLYLSNHCAGGCAYCGFASDRKLPRHRLEMEDILRESDALRGLGCDDVLLLTGEETGEADFNYLVDAVKACAERFHSVSVEAFGMTVERYSRLVQAGCTGVTLYQETYDPPLYDKMHRWGQKKDFLFRLNAVESAAKSGMRSVGVGALLGLGDPVREALCLFSHALHLKRTYWRCGVMVSFPRLRDETGRFEPPCPVSDRQLAQFIFAFRLCLPDVHLVLSTREPASFRDNMAGNGISRMSVASKTTVGGYEKPVDEPGQFDVSDTRGVDEFCSALRQRGLQPVFKNWDRALTS